MLEKGRKSGRCGDWTWYVLGGKQHRRVYVKLEDPQTQKQRRWRARFSAASRKYSQSLTDEQHDACIAAGAKLPCRRRLGFSGLPDQTAVFDSAGIRGQGNSKAAEGKIDSASAAFAESCGKTPVTSSTTAVAYAANIGTTPGPHRHLTGITPSPRGSAWQEREEEGEIRMQNEEGEAVLRSADKSTCYENRAEAVSEDCRGNAVAGKRSIGRLAAAARS